MHDMYRLNVYIFKVYNISSSWENKQNNQNTS